MPAKPAKILIGTPVYDEQVLVPYHVSILNLMARFQRRPEVGFVMGLPTSSLISFARNVLATRVLEDESFTHLLFIDADMGFRPELIEKMLAFGEPFVGAFYPARSGDERELARLAREKPGLADLREAAQPYIGEPWRDGRGVGQVRGEFVRAARIGTGLMLLERGVLERMREVYADLWMDKAPEEYAWHGAKGGVFQPFSPLRREDGMVIGEDISFCRRWIDGLDGRIWACVTERITHTGRQRFTGRYEAFLKARDFPLEVVPEPDAP